MTPIMQRKRIWQAGGALIALLIVVVAWMVVIAPQRSDAAALREDTEAVQLQNSLLAQRIVKLKEQAADTAQQRGELGAALGALPPENDLPAFNNQLAAQAQSHGIQISTISVDGGAAATGSTDVSGGLPAIPVTVVSVGLLKQQMAFLTDIQETGPRRVLVTSVVQAPAATGVDKTITMTVQLTVFTAPLPEATIAELTALVNGDSGT